MTQYLSKLARRLATIYGTVLVAACSEAAPRDFLGPDPNTPPPPSSGPVSLHIAPKSGAIAANQPLQFRAWGRTASGDSVAVAVSWNASGGQIGADGLFQSAAGGTFAVQAFAVGKPHLTDGATVSVQAPPSIFSAVHVLPGSASVPMGGTLQFHASAPLMTGGTTVPSVHWSATGGTISSTGLFSAGMAPGQFQVVGTTVDGVHSDTVEVTVAAVSLQTIALHPKALTMSSGEHMDFAVAGTWSDGTQAPPAVTWTAQGGTMSPTGRFIAGATPGLFPVVARHVPSGRADTALVTIMPGVARIEVTPGSYELQPGASKTFTAKAVRTDGVVVPVAATWAATGGTISAGGVYSAGGVPGNYRVIARYLGGAFADTAEVAVVVPAATLTGLAIAPRTAAVGSGGTVEFSATPTWSDGSSAHPALIWSATGGSVAGDGTWSAPASAGTYRVVVRHPASGLADTATVTVTEAPRVTAVTILGQAHSLQTGGTRQFTAQATWSDGVSRPVEWLWSATGGTISVNGLYSAGSVAGQFLVIASCLGCSAADSTDVTVTAAPPPPATLTSLVLSPPTALLEPGNVLTLHLAAAWSDGSSQVPDIAWTVQGGTRSGLNYTAGSTPGTYLIVARHAAGTRADTTVVTIAAPGSPPPAEPTLTALVLNPSSMTVNPGEQRTLTLAATWSDGSTTVPPVTWDATGGTLSGLTYTAGSTTGSYRIIVRHQGGTRADTTAVTIAAAAPTLQSLTITPNPASVPAGYSVAFSVAGTMSDGSTTTPTVTWTATGGTISSSGVFTASTATGSFQVTATNAPSGLSAQAAVAVGSPTSGSVTVPELPREYLPDSYPASAGRVIHVMAGQSLQTAIDTAQRGDVILLQAGATFRSSSHVLRKKEGEGWITIRTNTELPPPGTRVTPAAAAQFARIEATCAGSCAAIRAADGASHYQIIGVELTVDPLVANITAIVRLHVESSNGTYEQFANNIVLDRVYVRGQPNTNVITCVMMNAARVAVINSHISQCAAKSQDSQAISGTQGPGPFKIVNNYLEGAGENVMFGGADPKVQGLVPSDIEIRRNHFFKPPEWKGVYLVKNLFELKNAQRVLVEENVFENNWVHGQTGTAIVLKSTNQNGTAPWSVTQDVTFRYNLVRNSPSGLNISAAPDGIAVPARRLRVEGNLFAEIGEYNGTTGGRLISLSGSSHGGLSDVAVVGNTFHLNTVGNTFMSLAGSKGNRLAIVDNLTFTGLYGIKGDGISAGSASLNAFWNEWTVGGNGFIGNIIPSQYPPGNAFAKNATEAEFLTGYLLAITSPLRLGGAAPGVDVMSLQTRLGSVVQP